MSVTDSPARETAAGWEQGYKHHRDGALWGEEPICLIPYALKELAARNISSTVDLGCGDGRNLVPLCESGLECCGVDISETALSRAGHRLRARGQTARLFKADLQNLPFPARSVESLVCFDVFGQLPDAAATIKEFERVLKPGGFLFLNVYTTGDGTFGDGEQMGARSFIYKNTLFHYYEEDDIRKLFSGWNIEALDLLRWSDPPHGEFRPYEHEHESWIVKLSTKE